MANGSIKRVLDEARRKLVDTGTRNRLIHVNRGNKRANCLTIINEHSDDVFDILRVKGRRMRFKAMGKDKGEEGQDDMLLAPPDETLDAGDGRFTDDFLETPLGPEALARRLLRLAGDAKTAEEEQGLNILYMALGFLGWRESPASEILREAPLLLLPVALVRNERSSTYDIRIRDDDLSTNLPLQERLKQDFGISLPELEEDEDWAPSAYFDAVAAAIESKPGWSIDRDGMQLGFFSFAKLLMHRDLDPESWPDERLEANPLLAGLLSEGFEEDKPLFGPEDRLDALLDPADIIQVIDADASQTKVIEEVRRGASLVVQGPPGTGKSQTITNIIAAATHDGKSVLFVAEKMAALSVVHGRLVRIGLRDICLELHSRSANKKALAQELGRTLAASAQTVAPNADVAPLRQTRDTLNRLSHLLHDPVADTGDTPFGAIAEITNFMGSGVPAPSIELAGSQGFDASTRKHVVAAIERYCRARDEAGSATTHPFRGARALDLQPTDLSRLETELGTALEELSALGAELQSLADTLQSDRPRTIAEAQALVIAVRSFAGAPSLDAASTAVLFDRCGDDRFAEGLQAGAEWQAARHAHGVTFADVAWETSVAGLRAQLVRGQSSFWARLFGPYRRVSAELQALLKGELPKAPGDRVALVDQLLAVQALRKRFADDEAWLSGVLGDLWRGERTAFERLETARNWMAGVRQTGMLRNADHLVAALAALPDPVAQAESLDAQIARSVQRIERPIERLQLALADAGLGESLEATLLDEFVAAFSDMRADLSRYADWARMQQAIADLDACGAGAIFVAIDEGRLEPAQAVSEFLFACAEARWSEARRLRPELDTLRHLDRHEFVTVFRQLEKDRLETTRDIILSKHFEQIPRGSMGEMGVIRGEIGRKRGHKSIRWVVRHAGGMLQRIKPVMLMSPLSVAQFLPPDSMTFDLLVIDEASQVRPEDALGVVARARQIVVVGDQKQLPPTSFFARLVDDTEEDEEDEDMPAGATAADMESILSLCEARGLRSRMLEWHYRSRDPSLIRVSNAEFYEDGLVLPPSPLQLDDNYGLKFTRVPGVYARGNSGLGRKGTNRIEAEAVAKAVARHARDWPTLSLGVVAFSKTQAHMLTEMLERDRRLDPVLDAFLREGQVEDVFVKNIENVQGDERDVILISVGYGPQEPNGRLASMSFGPVNGEGGERRLNVLFSRARVRCEVFCSFDPGDIDPLRVTRAGPRILKRFLDYAKTGDMGGHSVTGLDADSPFEEDVAAVIRGLGYAADLQVGSAGFRIDIGVRHPDRPGQYVAAVECDGAAYHSALWARERDRLRQDVLENLGWRFHRIWSTDWFHRRDQEIRRLAVALEAARAAAETGIVVRGANTERPLVAALEPAPEASPVDIEHLRLTAPAYRRFATLVNHATEPHNVPIPQLAYLVERIVEVEGPVHIDEVARRVALAYGKQRTGGRITDVTAQAASRAVNGNRSLLRRGDFLMTEAQSAEVPVRDRSQESGTLLKADNLPPMEIRAAAALVRNESGELSEDDLVRAVARLLGFQRVGGDLAVAIAQAVADALPAGT